jgi:hypothetical protein
LLTSADIQARECWAVLLAVAEATVILDRVPDVPPDVGDKIPDAGRRQRGR